MGVHVLNRECPDDGCSRIAYHDPELEGMQVVCLHGGQLHAQEPAVLVSLDDRPRHGRMTYLTEEND